MICNAERIYDNRLHGWAGTQRAEDDHELRDFRH